MSLHGINIGEAIKLSKEGIRIARKGWNYPGLYLTYVPKGAGVCEYLRMHFPHSHPLYGGMTVPWLASQLDLLADDWFVLKEDENG